MKRKRNKIIAVMISTVLAVQCFFSIPLSAGALETDSAETTALQASGEVGSTPDEAAGYPQLTLGETIAVRVDTPGEKVMYQLTPEKDMRVRLLAANAGNAGSRYFFREPGRGGHGSGISRGEFSPEFFDLTAGSTYLFEFTLYDGTAVGGFNVRLDDCDTFPEMVPGEELSVNIENAGMPRTFRFTPAEDMCIGIEAVDAKAYGSTFQLSTRRGIVSCSSSESFHKQTEIVMAGETCYCDFGLMDQSATGMYHVRFTFEAPVVTSGVFKYMIRDDATAEIIEYLGKDSVVTIPAELGGKPVTSLEKESFEGADAVEIVIPESVTKIGDKAFRNCSKLEKLTIPEKASEIGCWVFSGCSSLGTLTVLCPKITASEMEDSGITELNEETLRNLCIKGIRYSAVGKFAEDNDIRFEAVRELPFGFDYYAYSNGTVVISDFYGGGEVLEFPSEIDGHAISEIPAGLFSRSYMRYSHPEIKKLIIPDGISKIGSGAFENCESLESVEIPESVREIGEDAFAGTKWLQNHPEGVVYINRIACGINGKCPKNVVIEPGTKIIIPNLFCECSTLESIRIPDSVTEIGQGAFRGCTALKEVVLSAGASNIGYWAFMDCTELETVDIPDGVTQIRNGAFEGCSKLENITFPASLKRVGYGAFNGTKWFENQPDGLVYINQILYRLKGECPKELEIRPGITSLNSHIFSGCEALETVSLPEGLESIGEGAFYGCTNLSEIHVPESVTEIGGYAFKDTKWMENQPDGIVYINKTAIAFKGECPESLTVKDGTETINDGVFVNKKELKEIILPEGLKKIGSTAFWGCGNLSDIRFPDSLNNIGSEALMATRWYEEQPDGPVYAGNVLYGYKGECPAAVDIKDGTTGISAAFFMNGRLREISIPDSVEVIGMNAFTGTGLGSVSLPAGLKEICSLAFWDTKETEVIVPRSVEKIGEYALGFAGEELPVRKSNYKIYGFKGTAAEQYAKDYGFEFAALDRENEQTYTDAKTNISVTGDRGLALTVTPKESGGMGDISPAAGEQIAKMFDIQLTRDGEPLQAADVMTVKIPCDNPNAKVYRIGADSSPEKMSAVYENGFLCFDTASLGVYMVTVPEELLIGDVNSDGVIDINDATTIQQNLADLLILTPVQEKAADANGDGKVDINDVTMIQMYLADLVDHLG